ncbi:MAG: bifunctional phosphopantothenoylcysteine decarboxylase/phosphopantothenate--cysteine ligase CoaBC, partial [Ardenticatenaceae bacterium]
MSFFDGKHILLGVTGSIATYKAVALASRLTQDGAVVDVIMTEAATKMVQPLSFQAITHRPVLTDMWSLLAETEIGHVTLAKEVDALLVAPATANTIAKLALGFADNFLTTTVLALRGALVIAPAMESGMWEHPATQEHVATLRARGAWIVEPESGHLASGARGVGRLAGEGPILAMLEQALGPDDLRGARIVITAGGTREAIDPVRYISNHSSGRMGYALAEAAARRGATVTLISAASLEPPFAVILERVESTNDMEAAVLAAIRE